MEGQTSPHRSTGCTEQRPGLSGHHQRTQERQTLLCPSLTARWVHHCLPPHLPRCLHCWAHMGSRVAQASSGAGGPADDALLRLYSLCASCYQAAPRPPAGLGDGTACWFPCLAPTHSELLSLLGSSPCFSRSRGSYRPHQAFPPLPPNYSAPATRASSLSLPHTRPGPTPQGLCTGWALCLEHCAATSATGLCPVSRYPLMCSRPPGAFHSLWMSACLPSTAEMSTLVSFYSDPPCVQGKAASPIKGQMVHKGPWYTKGLGMQSVLDEACCQKKQSWL